LYAEISGTIYQQSVRNCYPLKSASFEICSEIGALLELQCWSRGDKVHRAGEHISQLQLVTQGIIPTRTVLGKMVFRSEGPLSDDVFGPTKMSTPTLHNAYVASQFAATLCVEKADLFGVIKFDPRLCREFRRYALFTIMKKAAYLRKLEIENRLDDVIVHLPDNWSSMMRMTAMARKKSGTSIFTTLGSSYDENNPEYGNAVGLSTLGGFTSCCSTRDDDGDILDDVPRAHSSPMRAIGIACPGYGAGGGEPFTEK